MHPIGRKCFLLVKLQQEGEVVTVFDGEVVVGSQFQQVVDASGAGL